MKGGAVYKKGAKFWDKKKTLQKKHIAYLFFFWTDFSNFQPQNRGFENG